MPAVLTGWRLRRAAGCLACSGDCLSYFKEYGPTFVEWINDSSCERRRAWRERTGRGGAAAGPSHPNRRAHAAATHLCPRRRHTAAAPPGFGRLTHPPAHARRRCQNACRACLAPPSALAGVVTFRDKYSAARAMAGVGKPLPSEEQPDAAAPDAPDAGECPLAATLAALPPCVAPAPDPLQRIPARPPKPAGLWSAAHVHAHAACSLPCNNIVAPAEGAELQSGAPPAARQPLDPSLPANMPFLWHQGRDFLKQARGRRSFTRATREPGDNLQAATDVLRRPHCPPPVLPCRLTCLQGVAIHLVYRMAVVTDRKDASQPRKTRELWKTQRDQQQQVRSRNSQALRHAGRLAALAHTHARARVR